MRQIHTAASVGAEERCGAPRQGVVGFSPGGVVAVPVGVAVSVYFLEKGTDFFSKVRSVSRTGAILKMLEFKISSARPPPGSHLLEEYSVISL